MSLFERIIENVKKTVAPTPKKEIVPMRCHAEYRIAGTTFKNEDGTDRQEILKNMKECEHVKVIKYIYENQIAFKIVNCRMEQIGNIKKEDVPYVDNIYQKMVDAQLFDLHTFYGDEGKKIYIAKVSIKYMK